MALTYCVLASGSGGNCLWVRGGGVELLVDCGLSARATRVRLSAIGQDLRAVAGILCTHDHGDHVRGARMLTRKSELSLWASRGTCEALRSAVPPEHLNAFDGVAPIRIGCLSIEPHRTLHDAAEPIALVIRDEETSLAVVTDLGEPTESLTRALAGVDGLVLEMNHDEQMLAAGRYPEWLKKRIRGRYGHLSNAQGAQLLAALAHPGLQHLTLAHLSEENNTPDHARRCAEAVLEEAGHGTRMAVASQTQPGEPVGLRRQSRVEGRESKAGSL